MLSFALSVSFNEVFYFFSNQLGHFWLIGLIWKVKSISQSCPTLCNPINYSPWGFSVHGIFQARILEKIPTLSRGSPLLQGIFLTQGLNPCLLHCRQTLYIWATREAPLWKHQGNRREEMEKRIRSPTEVKKTSKGVCIAQDFFF